MNIDWRVVMAAIIGIVALEGYALFLGFNGTLLKMVLIILAGLGGWTLPQLKTK